MYDILSFITVLNTSSVKKAISQVQQPPKVCRTYCTSTSIRDNGKYNGIQSYYCMTFGKYFRESTGKVSFMSKKGNMPKSYPYHLLMGLSIGKCAKQTGICTQTSSARCHQILIAFEQSMPEGFEGIVESDDIFFLGSDKGNKSLTEPSCKRCNKATKRGTGKEQVAVMVSCGKAGYKEFRMAIKGRPSEKDLDMVFEGDADKTGTLCTDIHHSYTAFAKSITIGHQKPNLQRAQSVKNKTYYVKNVNNKTEGLGQLVNPFNGMVAKYSQDYMD